MARDKIETRYPSVTPSTSRPTGARMKRRLPQALKAEIARLFWSGSAIMLLLSLISYSPNDPSWSTWTSRHDFSNWMGRSGSIVADLLLQLLGLSSFGMAALFALMAARGRGQNDDDERAPFDWASCILFLLTLSSLLECSLPSTWMPWRLGHPGGLLGRLANLGLGYCVGTFGTRFLSAIFLAASIILLFRWQLLTHASQTGRKLGPLVAGFVKKLPLSMVAKWRKWREARAQRVQAQQATTPKLIEIPIATPQVARHSAPNAPKADEEDEKLPPGSPPIAARAEGDEEFFRLANLKGAKKEKKIEAKPAKPKSQPGEFQLPSLALLSGKAESKSKTVDKNWYLEKGAILVQKLKDFGVEGEIVHISPGPVITVYEFKPASGVKIKEISNLSDDLTLALSVLSVRIVAPIPGKPVVGIEIPSPHREMVFFKDMIEETPFYTGDIRIPIVLGRLASGEPVVAGLATMPHLLVAGSTGTGKSVFINTLICSLLYRYTPDQLKLILVDPKMVELSSYENVPHLLLPVVVDSKKAAAALRWTVDEMERRYSLMHKYGARHLDAYNDKIAELAMNGKLASAEDGSEPPPGNLPYIVVVIDEYADLMAVVPKDVELSIARLAQKARASGIHLVLAMQRPSTDVVTGTIKANFPSRISFRVASSIDSKTILDRTGADRLLGNGDMLFHSAGFTSLKRIQGAFISDSDLEKVVESLKAQGEPEYDERILKFAEDAEGGESGGGDGEDEGGELYDRAVRLVAEKGEASISLIQRHLKIGYNRAASLMEEMEKAGIVAQATGASKRRAVLVNNL